MVQKSVDRGLPDKIPPERLPLILVTQSGGKLPLVFPPGVGSKLEVAFSVAMESAAKTSGFVVIGHAGSYDEGGKPTPFPVGVLSSIKTLERGGDVLVFWLEAGVRVRLINLSLDGTFFLTGWELISDEIPSEAKFNSPKFRIRLKALRQTILKLPGANTHKKLPLSQDPCGATRESLGNLIDRWLFYLGAFVGTLKVLKYMQNLISERNVSQRLEIVTKLLNYISDNVVEVGNNMLGSAATKKQSSKGKSVVPKDSLMNFLFWERSPTPAIPLGLTSDTLDIPEGVEIKSIADMVDFLRQRVIGQTRAIHALADTFNMLLAGNFPKKGPLLKLVFAGPTGVGKTELVLALADYLAEVEKRAFDRASKLQIGTPFSGEEISGVALVRIPCADFAGEHAHGVNNLIGSPVGYYGSRDSRNATPPTLRPGLFPPNRVTVLLFDELEKAFDGARNQGAELMGILMELLDNGKYTNRWGDEVDFSNTVVLCTTNIGSVKIMQRVAESAFGFRPDQESDRKKKRRLPPQEIERLNNTIYDDTMIEYRKLFRPELIGRLERVIVFRFLNDAEFREIVKKEFQEGVANWAREKAGVRVLLSEDAISWVLDELGFEEGVRKVREFLRRKIIKPLTKAYNLDLLEVGKVYIIYPKDVSVTNGEDESGKTETQARFRVKDEGGSLEPAS